MKSHSYRQFKLWCMRFCELNRFHDKEYTIENMVRYFNTYKYVKKIMGNRTDVKLLSIGAGGAFVEAYLQKIDNYSCTIIDFPEAIEINRDYYQALGFTAIGMDVSRIINTGVELDSYDIILSLENIEHIPMAPNRYIKMFLPFLNHEGIFVVSTINLASINRLLHLLLLRPFFADPERFFSPTSFEHEAIHRREYLACEIVAEMEKAGLRKMKVVYTNNASCFLNVKKLLQQLVCFIPRFRICFIVSGEK